MDENRRRLAEAATSGRRTGRLGRDLQRGSVQSDSAAHALGDWDVTAPGDRGGRTMTNRHERRAHRPSLALGEREMLTHVTFFITLLGLSQRFERIDAECAGGGHGGRHKRDDQQDHRDSGERERVPGRHLEEQALDEASERDGAQQA